MNSNSEKNSIVLGIDIGGSFIKAGLVDIEQGKLISDSSKFKVPEKPSFQVVSKIIHEIISCHKQTLSIGIGYPGVVKNGTILSAAHLADDWGGKNLIEIWSKEFSKKVNVINDADAAGIAEMNLGAGKSRNNINGGSVALITLGTGIGTALFRNGVLFPNSELGHIYYPTGEESESVAAASVRTRESLSWEEYGKRVNRYLNYMNDLLTLDCFIIGGGISQDFDIFSRYIEVSSEVLPAKLKNNAGIIGASLVHKNLS